MKKTLKGLLAAHGLGLGAVWTGVYPDEGRVAAVREILGVPEGYAPLNVIPLGFPREPARRTSGTRRRSIGRSGERAAMRFRGARCKTLADRGLKKGR